MEALAVAFEIDHRRPGTTEGTEITEVPLTIATLHSGARQLRRSTNRRPVSRFLHPADANRQPGTAHQKLQSVMSVHASDLMPAQMPHDDFDYTPEPDQADPGSSRRHKSRHREETGDDRHRHRSAEEKAARKAKKTADKLAQEQIFVEPQASETRPQERRRGESISDPQPPLMEYASKRGYATEGEPIVEKREKSRRREKRREDEEVRASETTQESYNRAGLDIPDVDPEFQAAEKAHRKHKKDRREEVPEEKSPRRKRRSMVEPEPVEEEFRQEIVRDRPVADGIGMSISRKAAGLLGLRSAQEPVPVPEPSRSRSRTRHAESHVSHEAEIVNPDDPSRRRSQSRGPVEESQERRHKSKSRVRSGSHPEAEGEPAEHRSRRHKEGVEGHRHRSTEGGERSSRKKRDPTEEGGESREERRRRREEKKSSRSKSRPAEELEGSTIRKVSKTAARNENGPTPVHEQRREEEEMENPFYDPAAPPGSLHPSYHSNHPSGSYQPGSIHPAGSQHPASNHPGDSQHPAQSNHPITTAAFDPTETLTFPTQPSAEEIEMSERAHAQRRAERRARKEETLKDSGHSLSSEGKRELEEREAAINAGGGEAMGTPGPSMSRRNRARSFSTREEEEAYRERKALKRARKQLPGEGVAEGYLSPVDVKVRKHRERAERDGGGERRERGERGEKAEKTEKGENGEKGEKKRSRRHTDPKPGKAERYETTEGSKLHSVVIDAGAESGPEKTGLFKRKFGRFLPFRG